MATENIATKNLEKVIDNDHIEVSAHLDLVTADAYVDSVDAANHVTEVEKELEEKAEAAITESPETPEVKAENIYTKKLVLDESMEDFSIDRYADDRIDEDDYLDYDMFDFVYGIVTAQEWPRPKNPLDHPIRKFQYTGEDDYLKTSTNTGVPQVSTDTHGNVVIYANDAKDFADAMAVCDYYHIQYGNVTPSRDPKTSHWKFSLTIYVPMTTSGYPMLVEDFFAPYGWTLEDVIESNASTNWGRTHANKLAKDQAQAEKQLNDDKVEATYINHVHKAGRSNDPLEGFIKDMFADLDAQGLSYNKNALKKRFIAEFDDDFEDEE